MAVILLLWKVKTNDMGKTDSDIFVGQVLYRSGGSRRTKGSGEIVEVTVGKVGRKYFYLEGLESKYPIDKKTLRYDDKMYNYGFQLYRDKQDLLDLREKQSLLDLLSKHFSWQGSSKLNTLEQLRAVASILDLTEKS